MPPSRKLGLFYATFASATWGTVFVLSKWLLRASEGLSIYTLAFWRFAVCSAALWAMLAATGRVGKALRALRAHPVRFGLMGLLGGYAMYLLVLLSLRHTMANTTQIIMNSNAVFIAPLALLIGERIKPRGMAGLALGVAGCAIVVFASAGAAEQKEYHHVLGGTLAALGGLSWAGYTVAGRDVIRKHGGIECTAISMTIGLALLAATVPAVGSPFAITTPQAWPILYLGLVPTALGFAAWFKAMEALPANVVGPFQFLTPVIGVGLAACFLHEEVTWPIALGALMTFAGVYFSSSE